MNEKAGFGTRAIHAGQQPDPTTGAIMTPIYQTSTYVQEWPGKHKGYAYARGKNPTRSALEQCIAALENAAHGLCFSSGQGASDAIIKMLRPVMKLLPPMICMGVVTACSQRFLNLWGSNFTS